MLKFYNSLTNKKEDFRPIEKNKVKLYTCGPTVYDKAHIGNFRTFLFEDLLKRTLIAFGYEVKHIMNITDVDDKTIKRANDNSEILSEITEYYTELFFEDSLSLKILPANKYPLATKHIPSMIKMIKLLIDKDFAYVLEDKSGSKQIHFILETKDAIKEGLRVVEMQRIKHAEQFFAKGVKVKFETQYSKTKITKLIEEIWRTNDPDTETSE